MIHTRRGILSLAALATLSMALPTAALAATVKYSSAKYDQYIKGGKTFLLGVHASWCSTCDRQKRVINALRGTGSPYQGLTIMQVDWDRNRRSPLISKLNIPRRSTLIMFKNGKEVGRIVAGTSRSQIKGLIDKGF